MVGRRPRSAPCVPSTPAVCRPWSFKYSGPTPSFGPTLTRVGRPASAPRLLNQSYSTSVAPERPVAYTAGRTRGPERFFYDKGTYTGVHKDSRRGGPDIVKKDGFELSLRADMHGHKFSEFEATPGLKLAPKKGKRMKCPATEEEARKLNGPERFFYAKSSFTGVHKHGGPEVVRKELVFERSGNILDRDWLRPGHHEGRSSVRVDGHPLNDGKITNAATLPQRSLSRPTSAASGELQGPERFFYDRSTYTGICGHDHVEARFRNGEAYVAPSYMACVSATLAASTISADGCIIRN